MNIISFLAPVRRSRVKRSRGNALLCVALGIALSTGLTRGAFGQLRGPKITNETQLQRTLKRPSTIYVSDFAIDPGDFAPSGPGVLKGVIGNIRGQDSSPEGEARAIVDQMGGAIVENLQNKGLRATRVRSGAKPATGWVVRGRFSTVNQGNRTLKTAVGFGAGSTDVNVDVVLKEVVKGREKSILLFDTENRNGNGPGGLAMAAATKNPYAIAIKFAMSGRDLQKNIRKTAKLIADQVAKKAGV
jgi:hypothetical protein